MLRAVSEKYYIDMPKDYEKMLKGISNGFGVGHICAALVSAIMALGLVRSAEETASLRIELLERFYDEYGTLSCMGLKRKDECANIVAVIAKILDKMLECASNSSRD